MLFLVAFFVLSTVNESLGFLLNPNDTCPVENCTCSGQYLTCSYKGFTSVPVYRNRTWPSSHMVIYLYSNQIHHLPDNAFSSWNASGVSTVELQLYSNRLSTIDDYAFMGLESTITILRLQNNDLVLVPEALALLDNLQTLYIYDNPITRFTLGLTRHLGHSLQTLYFTYDSLHRWPVELRFLSKLNELGIYSSSNVLISIPPDGFQGFNRSLTNLYLGNTDIIPPAICSLHRLVSFTATLHTLNSPVPHCTPPLYRLTSMTLDQNFTTFPGVLKEFPYLNTLYVRNNDQLLYIQDDTIPNTCNLNSLYLNNNGLVLVPEAVQKCDQLTSLNLQYNNIEKVERNSFENLPKLSTIYLDNNPLHHISADAFHGLSSLYQIYLRNTNVKKINALSKVSSLRYLYLPPIVDCTCENLGWLEKPVHRSINLYYTSSTHCAQNQTETVRQYLNTTVMQCP